MRLRLLFAAVAISSASMLAGCEADYFPDFDYYPHHEISTTQSDIVLSGNGSYGGHNSSTPIIIPGSGSATNPTGTAPTQPSGLP